MQMGNKGAFIQFEAPELKPNIVTFSAVVRSFINPCFRYSIQSWILDVNIWREISVMNCSRTLMSSQWRMPTTSFECSHNSIPNLTLIIKFYNAILSFCYTLLAEGWRRIYFRRQRRWHLYAIFSNFFCVDW